MENKTLDISYGPLPGTKSWLRDIGADGGIAEESYGELTPNVPYHDVSLWKIINGQKHILHYRAFNNTYMPNSVRHEGDMTITKNMLEKIRWTDID